ncbi:hypothetical protein [Streptomyces noursei]|uniref:hypothetical protein n=1 Tax=Streptomyces noursei TaxID=1971 RepID=UPI00215508C1|nr:hypothetical protein [Streptomyces noursei]
MLVVTAATFTVAVLTGVEDAISQGYGPGARHWFPYARLAGYVTDLTAPVNVVQPNPRRADEHRLASQLLGERLVPTSGGPIAYVKTRPTGSAADTKGELAR